MTGIGTAELHPPFPSWPRCILLCFVDLELEVKAASVFQDEAASFLGAIHHSPEINERGWGDAVLAEHGLGRHIHWDDGDGLPSFTEAGLNHLQPEEGLITQQGGPWALLSPHVTFSLLALFNASSRARFSALLGKHHQHLLKITLHVSKRGFPSLNLSSQDTHILGVSSHPPAWSSSPGTSGWVCPRYLFLPWGGRPDGRAQGAPRQPAPLSVAGWQSGMPSLECQYPHFQT